MRGMLEDESNQKRARMMKEMQEENKRIVRSFRFKFLFRLKLRGIRKQPRELRNRDRMRRKFQTLLLLTL